MPCPSKEFCPPDGIVASAFNVPSRPLEARCPSGTVEESKAAVARYPGDLGILFPLCRQHARFLSVVLSIAAPNASCLNPFLYVPYYRVSCSILLDFSDQVLGAEAQPSTQSGRSKQDDDPLVRECLDMRRRSDGYLVHIEDRRQRKGGGLLLALKNSRRGLCEQIRMRSRSR